MADDDIDKRFNEIRKAEQPKTHHECRCRECDPLTAMAERASAWECANSLLKKGDWAEDDKPSVREVCTLADWLLYGPESGDGS